jgi:hypothetical protein
MIAKEGAMKPTLALLYDVPLWAIGIAAMVLLLAAARIGFAVGRRSRTGEDVGEDGAFTTTQGAILGLLALLLAFTYSLAAGRHDLRKQVVIDEANAIGTAYLRAGLMPSPHREELERLLRRYVDLRLELASVPIFDPGASTAARESEATHASLWSVVSKLTTERTPTPVDALAVAAVNDVIDLHAKRLAALRDQVPEIVLVLLGFVATVALALTGFAAGIRGRRSRLLTFVLTLLIVAVMLVTMDLDRPRRGFIRSDQASMAELKKSLDAPR